MSTIFWTTIILALLPVVVAFTGTGGVWKFLCILFAIGTVFGVLSPFGFLGSFGSWVVAWIFAGVARSARRRDL